MFAQTPSFEGLFLRKLGQKQTKNYNELSSISVAIKMLKGIKKEKGTQYCNQNNLGQMCKMVSFFREELEGQVNVEIVSKMSR